MSEDVAAGSEVEKVEKKPLRKIKFNQANMTLGDLEEFEEITGKSFNSAMKQVPVLDEFGKPVRDPDPEAKGRPLTETEMSMKGMVAMVFISMKKEDPTFTMDDARNLKLSEFQLDMSDEDADAPLGETDGESPNA